MAKRKRSMTNEKIEKWIAEGKGQGHKEDYLPWLTIQNVPSEGVVTRIKSWKVGRIHHLLSKLELSYFYILEWSDKVIDIREQFPILPVQRTIEIAESIGIKHPTDPETKEPIPITNDFMVTINENGKEYFCARTIKPANQLVKRILEKLTIEKRYYDEEGIDWKIVTDKDIPKALVENIEWIHRSKDLNFAPEELNKDTIYHIAKELFHEISHSNKPLSAVAIQFDQRLGLRTGSSLFIVQHMLAMKKWETDMYRKINPSEVISFELNNSEELTDHRFA